MLFTQNSFMNTITFAPTIPTRQKRPNGTYNVKIRITFKRKSRFLSTTLFASSADLTVRTLKLKQGPLLTRSYILIGEMQQALACLSPFDLLNMEVDDIIKVIQTSAQKECFALDFFTWSEAQILKKTPGARHNYTLALHAFGRFLGHHSIDINRITSKMVHDFSIYLESEKKFHGSAYSKSAEPTNVPKKKGGASIRYVKSLGSLFRAAQLLYNDEDEDRTLIPRNPFNHVAYASKPIHSKGQNSLSFDLMQRIILEQTDKPAERLALDVFVVSFGLMGANLADLFAAGPFEGKTWCYYRQKTQSRRADRAEMRVVVPDCLSPFLARIADPQNRKWLRLYLLHKDKNRVNSQINRWLRIWQKRNGVADFTLYAARHTWATLARSCAKVDKTTIDECLAHSGSLKMADIYVEKDWNVINMANESLLQLFAWP